MNVTVKDLNISYTEKGEGKPVLLLHGWGSSVRYFEAISDLLSRKYRVVALSFPGCDESEIMKEPWDIDDYCDLVAEFCEKINLENPILIGHSHGGRVIMKLVGSKRMSPEKVVFLDAAGLIPKKSFKKRVKQASFKTVKWVLTRPVFGNKTENLLSKARTHFGSADYKAAPEVLRKTMVSLVNTDLRELLPEFTCPTLLIWGENDKDTPLSDAKTIASLIKDSGLCVINGAGHFAFLERPNEVLPILNSFLM